MNNFKIDFDHIKNRKNTHSLKWDVAENELPMWVADMDFRTAPAILEALNKKMQEGIFGYNIVPDAWYSAIQYWWEKRHHFGILKEWLTFCTGVVPAISSSIKRITNVGDNVLVQTPVYNIFFNSIENSGRHVVENKLVYTQNGYSIDFVDLEDKLMNPLTTMMILCNPHNPVGMVWTKAELERIGNLCHKYHVTVLSDEIHCDVTEEKHSYTPFASVSEVCAAMSVTCISPSKAFNMAGIHSAAVVIPDKALRERVVRGLNSDEIAEPNAFAIDATIAAFTQSEAWLDALRSYISSNKKCVDNYLKEALPCVNIVPSNATYLVWLDCSEFVTDTTELCQFIRKNTGLIVTSGGQYRGNGACFIRINVACAKAQLMEGLKRLKRGIELHFLQN